MLDVNSKRIAKNTLLLYVRMLLTMIISLYTSRIVLDVLGVEDFGIYNIVAGVLVLFSFLETSLSSATQRFLNFYMGKADDRMIKKVFSTSLTIHMLLVFLTILLAETIGLWFLNTKLNIPENRIYAANWVYQLALVSTCLRIITIPYQSNIIANEKMSFYAYVGIGEGLLKLGFVLLLNKIAYDNLIMYTGALSILSFIVLLFFAVFNIINYSTTRYSFYWDNSLFKEILSFAGWGLFGQLANIGSIQGANILLNLFFSVTLNAAMGIANAVSSAAYAFVSNFQMAFRPQIVKSYAANDREYFIKLIMNSSKYSYYLLLLLCVPIYLNIDYILDLWLVDVPEYAGIFCQLIILYLLVDSIQAPLWMAVHATGKIRNYQVLMGSLTLLNIPTSYLLLLNGFSPPTVILARIIYNIVTYVARINYLREHLNFPSIKYTSVVLGKAFFVTILSFLGIFAISELFRLPSGSIIFITMNCLIVLLTIAFFGLSKDDKNLILYYLKKYINE